jgi:hypothetical protein
VRILVERIESDSGGVRGLVGLAADGRGWRWTRQLQPDRQAGVCVGSLDLGELDFGVVACVRQRRRQHLVQRCAQREHRVARWDHHRQRAAAARQARSGRICAAVNADAITSAAVANAFTNTTVANAFANAAVAVANSFTNTAGTNTAVTITAITIAVTDYVHLLDCALHPECWRRRNNGIRHRDSKRRLRVDRHKQRVVDRYHVRIDWYGERVCRLQRCRQHRERTNWNRDDSRSDFHGESGGGRT